MMILLFLAKEDVASSSLVTRFRPFASQRATVRQAPLSQLRQMCPIQKGESVAP